MKKRLHLLALFTALMFSAQSFAQEYTSYTDDFETAHDYAANGVDGTMWDGILLNDSIWNSGGVVAEITALNSSDYPGSLMFSTINSAWAWGQDYGAALYKTIADGADFEISAKIVGGDFLSFDSAQVNYHMPGLIAKVEDDTTFVLVQSFDIFGWGAVHGVRDIVPGEGLAQENWIKMDGEDTLSIADYPYIKLEKYEDDFTGYCSKDGTSWVTIYTVTKTEFADKNIQVGLYSATYTGEEGQVMFDDVEIIDYTDKTAISDTKIDNNIHAYFNGAEIIIKNRDNQLMNSVKLYSITGAKVFENYTINSSEISIPISTEGLYILSTETNGKISTKKVLVK